MNKLEKVFIIGPCYPYKGGIAHYTSLMAKALEKKYDIEIISYKVQYPKFLYPGNEQKDFENDSFKFKNTKYLINTINPFNWIQVANYIKKQRPDTVIVQWWHPYFSPCYWVLLNLIKHKTNIIFLCHNVLPHERLPMDRFIVKRVLKVAHAYIVQSNLDEQNLYSLLPHANVVRTVHPTYNAFKLNDLSKDQSRKLLNLNDEKILLFFGFVREYKGLKHLIKAMPLIKQQLSDIKLLIVGDFYQDKNAYINLINECCVQDCISIYDGYIPDKEVEKFFVSCDLVVLPYESATQSGIVQIAYGFDKPVIATDVGGLPEVVYDEKTGYIVPPKNEVALAEAIIKYFLEDKGSQFEENILEEAHKFSWERLVEIVEDFHC